jgi:UDP-glucose 4-epimerase
MRSALVWVVGRGGLLGSHLARAVPARLPAARCWDCVVPKFSWNDGPQLSYQLDEAVRAFAQAVRAGRLYWIVLWSAGPGSVGTTEPALQAETRTWELFLELLGRHLVAGGDGLPGHVFLASSAGGVFGNCPDQPITEASPCVPISAYGRNKLRQESILRAWASSRPLISYLIGRISNLYGPGQNLAKPQGLISHISRRLIYHAPVHIYVSLDTIRDYLFVEDCAGQVVHCIAQLQKDGACLPPVRGMLKIFAAERPASIAQIVGIFARLAAKRQPKIICAPNALNSQQPPRLEFRSTVWPVRDSVPLTTLEIGINRVHQHHLALYRQGQLSAPV